MYDIKNTVCELVDEENHILKNRGEYYLRVCYNLAPCTQELYDRIVIELTEHNCMSLLNIFLDKHMLYFCNDILMNDKYTYL